MVEIRRVVIVGQGYVGLPLAVRAVEVGYDVVGLDLDRVKVEMLQSGRSHVEDITDERLAAALATGRYSVSDDYVDAKHFDVAVISVPTPLRQGVPDLSYVTSAARELARNLKRGATVVLESTTYPGTTEEVVGPILEEHSGLVIGEFSLGYSPERIDPGNPIYRLENTPKIVSGVDDLSLVKVRAFFDKIVEQTVPVSSPKEAELTKLLENTFRHVNIALVNELAVFAHDLGIDVWEAIEAAETKPFGYMKFTPGPGVGGHCLPIDPSYLSWRVKQTLGRSFRFVDLANDVNEHMPDYIVNRLVSGLNECAQPVKGRRVLLLGLAYKKNTGDARESPSTAIASRLIALGADVWAVDPHVVDAQMPAGVRRTEFKGDELARFDAVLLLVDHDEFDLDVVRRHSQYLLDTRNVVQPGSNVDRL